MNREELIKRLVDAGVQIKDGKVNKREALAALNLAVAGSNLSSGYNSYWKVVKPFSVWIKVDSVPSNYHSGASQLYRPVYEKIKAQVGDEVHDLAGGTFFVRENKGWTAKPEEPGEFRPFDKNHSEPKLDVWPLSNLEETEDQGVKISYRTKGKP